LFAPPHLLSRKGEAGIKWRELGVAFENLRVIGLRASASYQSTLGSLLNPLNHLSAIRHRQWRREEARFVSFYFIDLSAIFNA
jgi:hypothetical protein